MMVARRRSHQKALRVEDTHAFCQQIDLEARSMNRIRQKQPTEKAERMTGIVRLGKLAYKLRSAPGRDDLVDDFRVERRGFDDVVDKPAASARA